MDGKAFTEGQRIWVTLKHSVAPHALYGSICRVPSHIYSGFFLSPACIFIKGSAATWNMCKVIMRMIKHLSWGVATFHGSTAAGQDTSSRLIEKLPTTSTGLIPGAWPPSAHITHLCPCLRLHCGPGFRFSQLKKGETGSLCLQVGSLELRATLTPTFIISKAVVRARVCVSVCERVHVCVPYSRISPSYWRGTL